MHVFGPRRLAAALILSLVAGVALAQTPSEPFTLDQALAAAGAAAPETAARRARVAAAESAVAEAGRLPNPVVEFRTENWLSSVGADGLPLDTFATASQTIEIGGKRGARRAVAVAGVGTASALAASSRAAVLSETATSYLNALRFRERRATLETQISELGELVRVLGLRVSAGTAAESDLYKLRTEEARAALELSRAAVGQSRALAALSGRVGRLVSADGLTRPGVPPVPATELDMATERRPDVSAARQAVVAARERLRLEDARAVPDPFLTGGIKRTAGLSTGVFAVTMPLPIFDRNRVARTLARGELVAAEHDLDAVRRLARADISATASAAHELQRRALEARTTLTAPARGARDAARAAFQSGALSVLQLLDAERVATDAMLVTIDLEIDATLAAIDARLALGEAPLP